MSDNKNPLDGVNKVIKKIVETAKNLKPVCKNCDRGVITTNPDGSLDCSFCKNPKL